MEGSLLFERTVADVRVSVTTYDAGSHLSWHVHGFPYVSAVLAGTYTEISSRRAQHCVASTVLFHPAGEGHADHIHGAAAKCLNLEFLSGWPTAAAGQVRFPTITPGMQRIISALTDEMSGTMDLIADELILLQHEMQRGIEGTKSQKKIDEAYCILTELAAGPSPVADAAKRMGIHRAHLWRRCRQKGMCRPRDLVSAARIRAAAERLMYTDMTLARIAAECGFFDQPHFSRRFKKFVGMTPLEFRKRFAGEGSETRIQYATLGYAP